MHILCIDGYNFMHRARSGFQLGDHHVTFNFMRNFRALVEKMKPSRVYFVTEGRPKKRLEALPEYKANRVIEDDGTPETSKKIQEIRSFWRQKDDIIHLLESHFPVSVIRHPDFECDDVIHNLIRRSTSAVNWTVVSNDSDFTQLLNRFTNVTLYNPMTKSNVDEPPYDYVMWKALRGDGSDNISGIPGVGDKTAEELVSSPEKLKEFLKDEQKLELFIRNVDLIKFHDWTDEEAMHMTCSEPKKDWDAVAEAFRQRDFKSILKEGTWEKFKGTFENLWG